MLDKQIHCWTTDTGNYYTAHERRLHNLNQKFRTERNRVAERIRALEAKLASCPDEEYDELNAQLVELNRIKELKVAGAQKSKAALKQLIENRVNQNIKTNGRDHKNVLDESGLSPASVISVFESNLSRIIGAKTDEFTDDLITVQIYYFELFRDLAYFGFWYRGNHYVYFSSSAGQIRRKKAVFIKESTWLRCQQTIMCGLTVDSINAKGGCNANKYLAYLALQNSATDLWTEFDIDKSIVIDDFETDVLGTFDNIDDVTFKVERTTNKVTVTHTDGAGMMLPHLGPNRMVRAPFIKGLLGVFDYRKFIELHNGTTKIKDIYGKEHDLIEEDIEVIFTKSQFKMWKYYDSWDEYKKFYHEYGCMTGYCNVERKRIANNRMTYQMLQSLTDYTDEEFDIMVNASNNKLSNLSMSVKNMQAVFGATLYNQNPTPFQEAIRLYPELLNDEYTKDTIRSIKDSLVKEYRSGKIDIRGKYTFVLPDFYAACCYWFLGDQDPQGLLRDGEVYTRLFPNDERLDCLRSPHLYQEHAIRYNLGYRGCGQRRDRAAEWFNTNAIYTSCHDLISRVLQFDCDGDTLLVVADESMVRVAARNMRGIVPLYYDLKKAGAVQLNRETIYDGLIMAFKHSNIGIYSNNISKIKNSPDFLGTGKAHDEALFAIKILTALNNYCIDAAKTLYMPEPPKAEHDLIARYTAVKLPRFFKYAKDKRDDQTLPQNKSLVNRLYDAIINPRLNFSKIGVGRPDWRLMVADQDIEIDQRVIDRYGELSRSYHLKMNPTNYNAGYLATLIKNDLEQFGYDSYQLADMLVKHLYSTRNRRKEVLWRVFGVEILEHMRLNIPEESKRIIQCIDCGEYFEVGGQSRHVERCPECQAAYRKFQYALKNRNVKVAQYISGLIIPKDVLTKINNGEFDSTPIYTFTTNQK